MGKLTIFYLVMICSLSVASLGYGLMLSSDEVIEHSKNFTSDQTRTQYLLKQADNFLSKNRRAEAEHVARFVLENLSAEDGEAQRIITAVNKNKGGPVYEQLLNGPKLVKDTPDEFSEGDTGNLP